MAGGLNPTDRLPSQKVRTRRANARLGIQLSAPSGLTAGHGGLAVDPQAPVFVDTSGVGLNYGNGLELSGTDLVVNVQNPILLNASGVGLNYATTYFTLSGANLTFANPITADITTTSDIVLHADTAELYLGTGKDMSVVYSGADGVINTSLVAASDLVITCGALKTLELTTGVFEDENVGALALSGPTGKQPGIVNFLASTGADTGIATYGVAVNEGVSGVFEIPHSYKEGTNLTFHVHWQGIAAPSGTDKVRWQLTYAIVDPETLVPVPTVILIEANFDTRYESLLTSFAEIDGSALSIGAQFLFTLERIVASVVDDEYPGEALLQTIGIHYQSDTVGSRQITTK